MKMKLVLAKIVFITHLVSIVFLIFGWLLPKSLLLGHIAFIPLTILQWWFNKNRCILTQIQQSLEGKKAKEHEQGEFVKSLFKLIGKEPSEQQLFYVIYSLMLLSLALSVGRITDIL